jgi:hypothetical protein
VTLSTAGSINTCRWEPVPRFHCADLPDGGWNYDGKPAVEYTAHERTGRAKSARNPLGGAWTYPATTACVKWTGCQHAGEGIYEAIRLRGEGLSWRAIAKRLEVPATTVVDACRCSEIAEPKAPFQAAKLRASGQRRRRSIFGSFLGLF